MTKRAVENEFFACVAVFAMHSQTSAFRGPDYWVRLSAQCANMQIEQGVTSKYQ